MRKVLSLLVAAVFVATAASVVFAKGVENSTITARIQFTGPGTFWWDMKVKNISDNQDAVGGITWAAGTTPGNWVNAAQYVMFQSSITSSVGRIKVYSDNKNAAAGEYQYTGDKTENLGGLITKGNTAKDPVSMSWTMRASTDPAKVELLDPEDTDLVTGYNSSYLLDKSNSDFLTVAGAVDNETYATILNSEGFKFGPGPGNRGGGGTGASYMYIGANFAQASTPNEYGCNTIIFQGINE
jgi:hypothetical protein